LQLGLNECREFIKCHPPADFALSKFELYFRKFLTRPDQTSGMNEEAEERRGTSHSQGVYGFRAGVLLGALN
jgi:hypothetical protein